MSFVWLGGELKYRPSLETVDGLVSGLRPELLGRLQAFVLVGECPWFRLLLAWLQDHFDPERVAAFHARFRAVPSREALQTVWPGLALREVPRIHRRLFGEPLETVNDGELPGAIVRLIDWLAERGAGVPGIFRLSADGTALEWLRSSLNAGRELDPERLDAHEAACLLKLYFRALPAPILPTNMYPALIQLDTTGNRDAAMQHLRQHVLPALSGPARALLGKLVWMLSRVAAREAENRMGARNLGICWAPNLMWDEAAADQFGLLKASLAVTELLVAEYEAIFS